VRIQHRSALPDAPAERTRFHAEGGPIPASTSERLKARAGKHVLAADLPEVLVRITFLMSRKYIEED